MDSDNVPDQVKINDQFQTFNGGYNLSFQKSGIENWHNVYEQKLFSYYGSLYGLCNKIAEHHRTPEEVLRYFGIDNTLPLAGWKTTSPIRQANFCISDDPAEHLENLKRGNPKWTEEALVNLRFLDALKQSLFSFELTKDYIMTYHDWYKQGFEFKNEFGETTMLAVKIYDFHWGTQ